jgi:hypothetical protein
MTLQTSFIFIILFFISQVCAQTSLPDFFSELCKTNREKQEKLFAKTFHRFCRQLEIDDKHKGNAATFYDIILLQALLTGTDSDNFTAGGVLQIPYVWHWVTPNPRHTIISLPDSTPLKIMTPPKRYAKYKSFADIDRTPFIYLSDLVSENPKYYHPACGPFYTFGWCSEREMTFNTLLSLMGYDCKIKQDGIHTWSEVFVPMFKKKERKVNIVLLVDNTYDTMRWKTCKIEKSEWLKDIGSGEMISWYNEKAHSSKEKNDVKGIIVSEEVQARIKSQISQWYKKHISTR